MDIIRAKRWGIVLLFLGLAIGVRGAWLLLLPNRYAATARIDITRTYQDQNGTDSQMTYDPYFIQTEFEIMKSDAVLHDVITNLHLDVEWGQRYANNHALPEPQALELLRHCLRFQPVRNTKMIDISAFSEDPKQAADIANAVADAYRKKCLADSLRLQTNGITALKDELAEQDKKIVVSQKEIDRLKSELKPPENATDNPDARFKPYWDTSEKMQQMKNFRSLLDKKIQALSGEILRPVILVRIVEPATIPATPLNASNTAKILLGAGIFLILAGIRFFWRAYFAAPTA